MYSYKNDDGVWFATGYTSKDPTKEEMPGANDSARSTCNDGMKIISDPMFPHPPAAELPTSVVENTRTFDSGARRASDEGKGRPDCISRFARIRVGKHMQDGSGAKFYGIRNWERGIPDSELYASALRHMLKYAMGLKDEDHLSAAMFGIQAIIHNEETKRHDLHDMPKY